MSKTGKQSNEFRVADGQMSLKRSKVDVCEIVTLNKEIASAGKFPANWMFILLEFFWKVP